jgi:hypothetical protein
MAFRAMLDTPSALCLTVQQCEKFSNGFGVMFLSTVFLTVKFSIQENELAVVGAYYHQSIIYVIAICACIIEGSFCVLHIAASVSE